MPGRPHALGIEENQLNKRHFILASVLALALLMVSASSNAATVPSASEEYLLVELTPSKLTVNAGESFTVELIISRLGAGEQPTLGAFDIGFAYGGGALEFNGYTLGDSLGSVSDGESTDLSSGQTDDFRFQFGQTSHLSEDQLNALQSDMFSLLTLEFTAGVPGGTSSNIVVAAGYEFFDTNGDFLFTATINEGVTVTVVPLPPALLLLAGALALIPKRRTLM